MVIPTKFLLSLKKVANTQNISFFSYICENVFYDK